MAEVKFHYTDDEGRVWACDKYGRWLYQVR
jgi:hypothetical protein